MNSLLRRIVIGVLAVNLLAVPLAAAPQSGVGVTHATLANGLQIYVLRNRFAPVVSIYTNYLAGSDQENITGLAHAQEHMMFRGSKTVDASQFSATMAVAGGYFNADTQHAITQFYFVVPAQDLDIALNLERSRAAGLLDSQAQWNQERGAITQEVTRDNSSAFYRLYEKMYAHVFAGTPDADVGLGTVASFQQIQAPALRQFYRRWYHPNDVLMVIAGDVDPAATIAKVRGLFGDIPAAPLPARRTGTPLPLTPLTLHDNSSDPITLALLAYRTPGYTSPDYFAGEILNDVLQSPRGLLYDLKVAGKSLETFAFPDTQQQLGMTIVGSAVPASDDGQTAVTDLKAVMAKYQEAGVPADLVAVAKARELAQAQFAGNSIDGLAQLWSQSLAVEHRTPAQDLAGLQRVTVDDVDRVLRTYYDNATATVAIATPKAAAGAALGGREGENNTVEPAPNTQLPPFARRVLAQLHVPPELVKPIVQTLPNGLKLIVVPTTLSPTVVLRGEVATNAAIEAPAGEEGVDQVVDGLFEYGTTTLDRVAFQTGLDKIAADVSAGSSFSLDVLASHFERGVQLLADDELHPAFPEPAFAVVKQQLVGYLTGELQSPDHQLGIALADALYPVGDPDRRHATPQSVGSLTLEGVKSYYASAYRPDETSIVVVGDVTPARARAAIAASFGDWSATGPKPDVFPPAVPRNAPASVNVPATGRIQTDVTLEQTIPIGYNNPDFPVLQLANAVLSGGFYDSILAHDLRQVHGYVYTVGSRFGGGHNRSTFSVTYGADPQNVDPAASLVVSDLKRLQTTTLPNDRLLRAKALALSAVPLRVASYDGVAGQLLTFAVQGRPLDQDHRTASAQFAATPEAVRSALARWVRPDGFVRAALVPAR